MEPEYDSFDENEEAEILILDAIDRNQKAAVKNRLTPSNLVNWENAKDRL